MAGKEDERNSKPPEDIPLKDLAPNAPERNDDDTNPATSRRSFHQRTRSLFQRGRSPDGRPPSPRYGQVTTDVPNIQVNDSAIDNDDTPTRRSRDSGRAIASPKLDVTTSAFDNEGGMNLDLDTMREGLMDVLESEATGSWLPGHGRNSSRSPGHARMASRTSMHTRRSSRGSNGGTTSPRRSTSSRREPTPARQSMSAGGRQTLVVDTSAGQRPMPTRQDSDGWGRRDDDDDYPRYDEEDEDYFQGYGERTHEGDDSDTIGLTNPMHLQPMAGTETNLAPTPSPRGRKRSNSNVKFHTPSVSPSSRLGDNLNTGEQGLSRKPGSASSSASSHNRKKSLVPGSPSSPVRRVSVAVQNISQRVVNLSNDPNANVIRRSPSTKSLKSGHESPPEGEPASTDDKTPASVEKPIFAGPKRTQLEAPWRRSVNPLQGKSLRIFPPDNPLRMFLCDVLVHPVTEPFILALILFQTCLLTADAAKSKSTDPADRLWGSQWIDWAILGIFIVYTLEIFVRMIVSGFIINPDDPKVPRKSLWPYIKAYINHIFSPDLKDHESQSKTDAPPSLLRSFTLGPEGPGHTQSQQRFRLARRAFLRHSFNRLDFVAVVSYWITFTLVMTGQEASHHVALFRMMSCLRILRLLGITSGTAVILRSLKRAAPLLVNVAILIGFFWLLFAIVGVQSFKGSLRRSCVWIDPAGIQANYTQSFQFCGGYLDQLGNALPYLLANGQPGAVQSKGYLCPPNSMCVESQNPYSGTVSFDNIFQSLELVFVIISSNTFTDLMYYTADSDYFASCLFFVFGIIILTFWLMNLLVAVITSSFQIIREEGKKSAFTAQTDETEDNEKEKKFVRVSKIKIFYDRTEFVWIIIIAIGLVVACFRSTSTQDPSKGFINGVQIGVTLMLIFEMVLRIVADYRHFHMHKRNWIDLGTVIVTGVMELPIVKRNPVTYAWLTLFQIIRVYRVVLFVPVTRDLITLVMGSAAGLLNLLFFVGLITFFCSIFAVQLLRGDIPAEDSSGNVIQVNFDSIFNSFLGMYQILSTENWTSIMYSATSFQTEWNVAWISVLFFIIWFILSNSIILNMFIAVIQENFDVTEDEKRLWQIRSFLQRKDNGTSAGNLSLSSMFGFGTRTADPIEHGHAGVDMLTRDIVVDEFLDEHTAPTLNRSRTIRFDAGSEDKPSDRFFAKVWAWFISWVKSKNENPFHSDSIFTAKRGEIAPTAMAQELSKSRGELRKAQREYLLKYPKYNVSLHIFYPNNPIRRLCQKVVGPSHGAVRFEGSPPYKPVWFLFSGFVYCSIIGMVLLACFTTPLYQKQYFVGKGSYTTRNWFVFADIGFAALFTTEALIKVVADGFYWTPNAYLRNVWGCIDSIVLITLWISVATSFANQGEVARAVGAFKALRALRLLNVSDSARETFNSILFGARKLISASFVSLSLLIPFAIYGLNLFAGKMVSCNDGNTPGLSSLQDCVFEYPSTPYNWDVLAPRVASNPWYSFDNFASSLFILFQIVSQEGWTNVMWQAMSVTGIGQQPVPRSQQVNAIFFIAFNILGAVFVLTLFVSVFMRNYTEQTGVAFLTAEQRSWLEMRKILRQVRPSKRPSQRPKGGFSGWCYDNAVQKHGKWSQALTGVLLGHLFLLVVEYYPSAAALDTIRDIVFLGFTLFYITNITIRIVGLGWKQYMKSRWDVYMITIVMGTAGTTTAILVVKRLPIFVQFQKLFLVLDTLLLIPRNNQLDQLFKTAAASFTAIANLMITWLVLFLVYAIALVQAFGLTKIGPNGNGNFNFRTVPNALIVLFRMSCGEGWDQIMDDFSVAWPNCVASDSFFESDCGSKGYARFLFVSWNIISMYIFVSMFVSLIFESFSYVYQQAGGLQTISREDIRNFKKTWSKWDPDGSGYMSLNNFPRFLGDLEGIFAINVYDHPHTVKDILKECRIEDPKLDNHGYGVDLEALNRHLETIPVWKVQRQRHRFAQFYEECLLSINKEEGGLSFTSVLMMIAHYKVVSDSKSLKLEEYLRRRAKLQLVEEQRQRNIVRSFLLMIIDLREYRKALDLKAPHKTTQSSHIRGISVPQIFIESESTATPTADNLEASGPAAMDFGKYTLSLTPPGGSPANSPRNSLSLDTGYRSPPLPANNRGTLTPDPKSPTSPDSPSAGRNSLNLWQNAPGRSRASTSASNISPGGFRLGRERSYTGESRGPVVNLTPGRQRSHTGESANPGFGVSLTPGRQRSHTSESSNLGFGVGLTPGRDRSYTASSNAGSRHSRAESTVSQADVMEAFQDSAWGGAMRRSITTTRRSVDYRRRASRDIGGDNGDIV